MGKKKKSSKSLKEDNSINVSSNMNDTTPSKVLESSDKSATSIEIKHDNNVEALAKCLVDTKIREILCDLTIPSIDLVQRNEVLKLIDINIHKAKSSSEVASKMLGNVQEMPKLKLTEAEVPKDILPPGYAVTLTDVRIATRGPDETIYRNNKWIRNNITRGLTFMRVVGLEKSFDFAIYANKKFTGGVGDDDDFQPENNDVWREFCLQSPQDATEVICMTKLNGEAGHFAIRYLAGDYYIIAGSKNVHMLFRNYEDIERYTDSRYSVARTVSKAVLNAFHTMADNALLCLKQLLNATKMTVVCEVLQPDYQHIVNLSSLKESTINFLMFSSICSHQQDSFTAIPPHLGLAVAKAFQLPTPEHYSIPVKDVQETVLKIRGMRDSEGCVLYYVNGVQTIGLAKVKTAWYVLLRALREKVDNGFNSKRQQNKTLQEKIKATHKRFNEIQKWIKFSDEYRRKWEVLGKAFFEWLDEEIKHNRVYAKNLRPKFPIIWEQFLENTNRTDNLKFELT